jgi:transcriptional regulator with XRE-family HTH domain
MNTFERVLGQVIAEERRRAGLTQEALAYRCKLHPTYISQLERGVKSPTLRVFRILAEAMGTSGSNLLRQAETSKADA